MLKDKYSLDDSFSQVHPLESSLVEADSQENDADHRKRRLPEEENSASVGLPEIGQ